MKLAHVGLIYLRYENENEGVNYKIAPFKVSSKCCYYLKKSPAMIGQEHNSVAFWPWHQKEVEKAT